MEQHSLTPSQHWCKVQESNKGLRDKHSKFELKEGNVTDTGKQVDHRNTGKGKSKNTGKGKSKHVDVVETEQLQPSETASTLSAIESGDADESMNRVKPGTEAWRLIHSRYAQNTTEMISG